MVSILGEFMDFTLRHTVGEEVPLGKKSSYPASYDPSLLFPIERDSQRQALGFFKDFKMTGYDLWLAHELFWLNNKGKPMRAKASFFIPANSKFLVESKSVKLYLHSLNHERFAKPEDILSTIYRDISKKCRSEIRVLFGVNKQTENNDEFI